MFRNFLKTAWATTFVPLTNDLGGSQMLVTAFQSGSIAGFLQQAFKAAIVIGAMLAVARIAYGGFLYMTKDSFSVKINAKEVITNALIGLVLLVSIVLILEQINPNLLNLDFAGNINGDNVIESTPAGEGQFGPIQSAPAQ